MPVYNGEKYVKKAILFVINQPCKDLKLIVVNDGSSDSTIEILKELKNTYKNLFVINQDNRGASVARNNGIQFCINNNAKYITFLDSDDEWTNEFYTDKLKSTIFETDADSYHFSWFEGNEALTLAKKHSVHDGKIANGKVFRHEISFCSYIYKLSIIQKYVLSFPVGIKAQEDCAFQYLFFTFSEKVVCINQPMFIYRSNISSISHKNKNAIPWYLDNILPAWSWVKHEFVRIEKELNYNLTNEKIVCDSMIKTYISEFIEVACSQGIATRVIIEIISRPIYIDLYNSNIWVDANSLKRWDEFKRNPSIVWVRYRLKGIISNLIRRLLRNNSYVQKLRYPIELNK